VLFVETVAPDPQLAAPLARFRTVEEFPNLMLLRVQFPAWRWNDGDYVDAERRRLLREFLASPHGEAFSRPVQWFYDPMAVRAFAGELDEILTVYDCMDELSQFRGAPPEIGPREAELLAWADLVFTGGRKLFESKSQFHRNCHFYGCGVELAHFARARRPNTAVPADVAALRKPVLGYFGVVDERLDYELLDRLAGANPEWSVAMIGPVLKVDPATLPRRPNLHWLGQRPYAELPALCKGFDVCLMPFALNQATEFINPTKALEYMATGRPIVGTPVADVVRNFGAVVKIAASPEEFIGQCRRAVARPDRAAVRRGLKLAAENTWDSIVEKLEGHIRDALLAGAGALDAVLPARKGPRRRLAPLSLSIEPEAVEEGCSTLAEAA
jgi:glycosyltransferase involved in cell wall biosynthesis